MELLSLSEMRKKIGITDSTLRRYLDVYAEYLPKAIKLGKTTKYPASVSQTLQNINLWLKSGLSHKEVHERLSVGEGEPNALPQQLQKDKFTVLSENIRELTNVVRELNHTIASASQQQIQSQINNKLNTLLSHITTRTQLQNNEIESKPGSPIVAESHEKTEPDPIQFEDDEIKNLSAQEVDNLTIHQDPDDKPADIDSGTEELTGPAEDQAPDISDKPEIGSIEHRKQIYDFIHTRHKQGQGNMNLNEIMQALNEVGIEARAGGTWNTVGAINSAYLQLKREFCSPGKSLKESADTHPPDMQVESLMKARQTAKPKAADTTRQKKDPVSPQIIENDLDLFTGDPIPKPTLPDCRGRELTVAERDKYLFRVEEMFPGKGKNQLRADALNKAGILTGSGRKWKEKNVMDNLRLAKKRAEK